MYNLNPLYDKIEEVNIELDYLDVSDTISDIPTDHFDELEYELQKIFYRLEKLKVKNKK